MKTLLSALLSLSVSFLANAESGVAYLAAQGYTTSQCTKALRAFEGVKNPVLAILWGTFTKKGANTCAQRFLVTHQGEPHTLEIHFSNEAGRRNHRLFAGELCRSMTVDAYDRALEKQSRNVIRRVEERAVSIATFFETYANADTRLLLSTGLEDNYSRKAYRVLVRELKKNIPDRVLIVRNPLHATDYYPLASFIELHGPSPNFRRGAPCISSLDGADINFGRPGGSRDGRLSIPEVRSYLRRYGNCTRLLWWSREQGTERGFSDPHTRDFRILTEDVNQINKLLKD